MMSRFLMGACLLSASFAWANGETLYVRPVGGSYGTEDGTSYANAWDGFLNGMYNAADTAGQVDPGDTLYVCGAHTAQQMEIYQDGTAALPIDIDFGCPSDPGSIAPTAQNYALYIEASYLTVHGGTVSRGSLGTISIPTNGGTIADRSSVVIYDMAISECLNTITECLGFYGTDVTIRDNLFTDSAGDMIHGYGGKRATIYNNTFSRIAIGSVNDGDAIHLTTDTDGSAIYDNVIDHTDVDVKYCVIVSSTGTPGHTRIYGNTCLRQSTDTVGSGIRADSEASIYANAITGGQYGIQCAVIIAATPCQVYGNEIVTPHDHCVILGANSTVSQVWNNTCINPGLEGIFTSNNSANVALKNNVISTAYTQCIDKQANNVEGYNDLYGCSTPVANSNVGTSTGPGTITTDPAFILTTDDYRPRASSPVKRAGISTGYCVDARGRVCPPDSPNIGAYQSTSGDPAATRAVRN